MQIKSTKVSADWKRFTLTNDANMRVAILNYGGIIEEMIVPDKDGNLENVVLGYRHVTDYADNPNCFGALVGRVAGRIQDASFSIDGKPYRLDANEGAHHLHGGAAGFHHVVWEAEPFETETTVGVKLTHDSVDGASGYPGNVTASVTYTLTNDNRLILDYTGTTDATTPLAMTNHTYFNLSGDLRIAAREHHITMNSSRFAELDAELIPTGALLDVEGTPFDFRKGRKLADGIPSDSTQNTRVGGGYDHYFLLDDETAQITVSEEKSGRILRVETDQPGVVLYTANGLDDGLALNGGTSRKHLGVCLETQAHPAALHHEGFPNVLLHPNDTYQQRTVFAFDVMDS